MKKIERLTPMMIFGIRIMTAAFLTIGGFMGFANDPALSGMFWMLTGIWIVMEAIA